MLSSLALEGKYNLDLLLLFGKRFETLRRWLLRRNTLLYMDGSIAFGIRMHTIWGRCVCVFSDHLYLCVSHIAGSVVYDFYCIRLYTRWSALSWKCSLLLCCNDILFYCCIYSDGRINMRLMLAQCLRINDRTSRGYLRRRFNCRI